jgi:hypothetical protein
MSKAGTQHRAPCASAPPSRRALFGAGASLLLAGTAIATAAHGAPPDADAELVRLHHALLAQGEVVARIEEEAYSLPGGINAESRAQEMRLTEADDAWYQLLTDIIDTPARTAIGLRVKAEVTLIAQEKYVCVRIDHTIEDIVAGHDGNIEDRLALSIARDLLSGRAVA